MKVLIADDELLSRESLKSMLKELELPVEIIGEAEDGRELTQMALSLHPEIVVADIRMPEMNGLEAIRFVRQKLPETQWVILTGFSEFEYAKESIKLGVTSYLLKPVDPSELEQTFQNLYERNKKDWAMKNRDFEKDLTDLSIGARVANDGLAGFQNIMCSGILLIFDTSLGNVLSKERQASFFEAIHASVEELMECDTRIGILPYAASQAAVIFVRSLDRKAGSGRPFKERLTFRIKQKVLQFSENNFAITTVELKEYTAMSALLEDLRRLSEVLPARIPARIGALYPSAALFERGKEFTDLRSARLAVQLQECRNCSDYLEYMKKLDDFETRFYTENFFLEEKLRANFIRYFNVSLDCGLNPEDARKQWHAKLGAAGDAILSRPVLDADREPADIIEQVKNYIDRNYMKNIGIMDISDSLHLTPNYLSTLFHKKTGVTFKKYLTDTRMIKAKELLTGRSCKIQQVSKEVGYYSTRYFAKLFKNYYNYYPSELNEERRVNKNTEDST